MSESLDAATLFSVGGKHILITGGTRGIGKMIARTYLTNGATVYIAGRDGATCAATETELSVLGPCRAIVADVATDTGIRHLVTAVEAHTARLDILVNNAGTVALEPIDTFPASGWDDVLALNLKAPFMVSQAFLPLLRAAANDSDPARIIHIGSIGAEVNISQGGYSYCASKAGLAQLSRLMARDLAPDRITVNVIAPGGVRTELFEAHQSAEEVAALVPLGRLAGPQDIGAAALYLASRAGAWVTGASFTVDGGALVA